MKKFFFKCQIFTKKKFDFFCRHQLIFKKIIYLNINIKTLEISIFMILNYLNENK